jgi:rubrerythrin
MSMTREQFRSLLDTIQAAEQEVRDQGQKEYAHDDQNAFRNFDALAKMLGVDRKVVLWVYLQKHLDGIVADINGHKSQREDVRGRIKDARLYLALLWGMYDDELSDETRNMDQSGVWGSQSPFGQSTTPNICWWICGNCGTQTEMKTFAKAPDICPGCGKPPERWRAKIGVGVNLDPRDSPVSTLASEFLRGREWSRDQAAIGVLPKGHHWICTSCSHTYSGAREDRCPKCGHEYSAAHVGQDSTWGRP